MVGTTNPSTQMGCMTSVAHHRRCEAMIVLAHISRLFSFLAPKLCLGTNFPQCAPLPPAGKGANDKRCQSELGNEDRVRSRVGRKNCRLSAMITLRPREQAAQTCTVAETAYLLCLCLFLVTCCQGKSPVACAAGFSRETKRTETGVVWQIGQADNSAAEFALAPANYAEFLEKDFGREPRHSFINVLDRLKADEKLLSPLAYTIGEKGYHATESADGPYPWESVDG